MGGKKGAAKKEEKVSYKIHFIFIILNQVLYLSF